MPTEIVGTKFPNKTGFSEKTYCYKTNIPTLKIGDWCVVVVNNTPTCVMITEKGNIPPEAQARATNWIVSKIDLTEYEDRQKHEILNRDPQMREFTAAEYLLIYNDMRDMLESVHLGDTTCSQLRLCPTSHFDTDSNEVLIRQSIMNKLIIGEKNA